MVFEVGAEGDALPEKVEGSQAANGKTRKITAFQVGDHQSKEKGMGSGGRI